MGRDQAPATAQGAAGDVPGAAQAPGVSVAVSPDGEATITIGARLGADQRVAFHRAYDDLLRDARIRSMTVDLRTVDFLHHDALGMLLVLADTAGLAGVPLAVSVVPGPVLDKLRMMDMGRWFTMKVDARNAGSTRLEIGRGGQFVRYCVGGEHLRVEDCVREGEAVLDLVESLQVRRLLVDGVRRGLPRDPVARQALADILEQHHAQALRIALLVPANGSAQAIADALEVKALILRSDHHADVFQDESEALQWLTR